MSNTTYRDENGILRDENGLVAIVSTSNDTINSDGNKQSQSDNIDSGDINIGFSIVNTVTSVISVATPANPYTQSLDYLVSTISKPSNAYEDFKKLQEEGTLTGEGVKLAVTGAMAFAMKKAIESAPTASKKLSVLGKFSIITPFVQEFYTNVTDSFVKSEGNIDKFAELYSNHVDSIKMDNWSDFFKGVVTGETLLKGASNIGKLLSGQLYELMNDDVINSISQSSQTAQSGTRQTIRRDPLTLDLDNDGIETIAADGSVKFDGNADGIKRGTGWVSGDDALLVRDIDGSGQIENGRELFGDATVKQNGDIATDGFDALRDLDSSGDGIFDANDEAFDEVQVWQDANSDGISQADELRSLSEAGIASIDLNATTTTTNTDGGIISKTGSYTKTDGTTAEIGNLDFNQNAIYREYTNKLDTSVFAGMMSMAGIGEVRDLQESATQSSKLADLLGKMSSENYTTKLGLADDLLTEWKNTSDFSDTTNLETVTLEDGTSFKFEISDAIRSQLDKVQVLETFSSNKLIQTNLNGDTLTITSGNKARNYTIVRGQENVLTDGHFTSGWTTYRSGWSNVTDLNLGSINSGYETLLTNIKDNIFTQTEYPKVLEKLEFGFDEFKLVA